MNSLVGRMKQWIESVKYVEVIGTEYYVSRSAAFKIQGLLNSESITSPGPKIILTFPLPYGAGKEKSVDPQNPENVTPCSLDPVVSHILTFMTA